jgi:hypothetical protein
MSRAKTVLSTVLLGAIAFALALAAGLTGIPGSYLLSVAVSVVLCPLLLGWLGARWLRLGPAAALIGINFLPVAMALDARFHLGEATGFGWLLAAIAVSGLGWRLGRVTPPREDR